MTGQTIAQYKILEKLGEGGMGVVYKAHDTKLDRMVALKFLPERLSSSEQDKARFIQEARAASALNHPNVCIIHDIQEHAGQMFIVMEYVEGQTIRKKFEAGPMTLSDAAAYGIQIGEALQEAHAKSIVHRDIKADNIMVNVKNQVKVMDFGLAKLKGSLKLTKTSSTIGTLAYMAPEQIQGGEVDSRSDIFSFGVLLFEMLTCQTPFRGGHEAAMVYSIVNEEPDPLEKYRPELPPILGSVIARALEKNPDDRYQSVGEMVIEFRRLLKQSSKVLTGTHRISAEARAAARPPEAAGAPKGPGGKRGLYAAAGVALASALLLAAYFLFLRSPESKPPALSFQSMKITRLTSTGKAGQSAVSPDGKCVVYSQVEGEKQSLWVRQISTGSTVQIRPADDVAYAGLSLSNDGDNAFYTAQTVKNSDVALYQIPSLGGAPRKVLAGITGAVTFSPDGKRMAFNRIDMKTGEFGIAVANADGSDARILATHKGEKFFEGDPAWSPDGSVIAAPMGSWDGGYHSEVIGINVHDGSERVLSPRHWLRIRRLRWLPDGSGLLVVGQDLGTTILQVWLVDGSGASSRLTNDLNSYDAVSLTADGKTICMTQIDETSNIYVLPRGATADPAQVTRGRQNGAELSFAPDGRIVYSSAESGNIDLWICDADGSNKRQLTNDPSIDYQPCVSPDGTFILFTSWRSGIPNIWRMDMDGGNLKQLTTGGEDYNPDIAPDGSWFAFGSWDAGPLYSMRASTAGGEPTRITSRTGRMPVISPDGRMVTQLEEGRVLRVVAADRDTILYSLQLPPFVTRSIRWTRDGKGISYVDVQGGVSNVWIQPLDGSPPVQATHFTSDLVSAHQWSPDGKFLAVTRTTSSTDILLMTSDR
jgi:serine/threonine protein kinase/Tol biopolymer transport system component